MNASTSSLEPTLHQAPSPVESVPRVVLLRRSRAAHFAATWWARRIAHAVHGELVAVRLLARPAWSASVLFPHLNAIAALGHTHQALRLLEARVRWHSRYAEEAAPAFVSRVDDGAEDVAAWLAGLSARLIVLAGGPATTAEDVCALVEHTRAPVFLARRVGSGAPVLAATSLALPGTPVLSEGAWLGHSLGTPVTFVHNVLPPHAAEAPKADAQLWAMQRVQHLERLATQHDADLAVTRTHDALSGVLDVLRRSGADVVVVGAASTDASSLATRLLDATGGNVLVVPTPGAARASRAKGSRILETWK